MGCTSSAATGQVKNRPEKRNPATTKPGQTLAPPNRARIEREREVTREADVLSPGHSGSGPNTSRMVLSSPTPVSATSPALTSDTPKQIQKQRSKSARNGDGATNQAPQLPGMILDESTNVKRAPERVEPAIQPNQTQVPLTAAQAAILSLTNRPGAQAPNITVAGQPQPQQPVGLTVDVGLGSGGKSGPNSTGSTPRSAQLQPLPEVVSQRRPITPLEVVTGTNSASERQNRNTTPQRVRTAETLTSVPEGRRSGQLPAMRHRPVPLEETASAESPKSEPAKDVLLDQLHWIRRNTPTPKAAHIMRHNNPQLAFSMSSSPPGSAVPQHFRKASPNTPLRLPQAHSESSMPTTLGSAPVVAAAGHHNQHYQQQQAMILTSGPVTAMSAPSPPLEHRQLMQPNGTAAVASASAPWHQQTLVHGPT